MISIRRCSEADDDTVTRLLIRTFDRLYATMRLTMSPERRAYLGDQAGRRVFSLCFVGEIDGKAVATVTLTPPSARCDAWIDGAWDLRLLGVDPTAQRQGVARALVDYAERYARDRGGRWLCLHVRRGVAHQARFYHARGYARDPAGDLDGEPYQEGYAKKLVLPASPDVSRR